MKKWRVRECITSDTVHTTWVVADGVDGQSTSEYLTLDGVIERRFGVGHAIRFPSRETAEAALWAAKLRGDVQ